VRAPGVDAIIAGLSGGNQQKIVLAKWLAAHSRILILDEPTRGVDVGAKAEIHALIDELAASGNAVILISSELPEVLNLSTRILVLREGRIAGELTREKATQYAVMRLMAGIAA
jgi:ABC-type sugar transport system ATPase subunit